ncbi:MAG: LysM peptidoglycan-binding domain-containing protein [Bacteroidales bacterium]
MMNIRLRGILILLWLIPLTVMGQGVLPDAGFRPFERSLAGLGDLHYVKQAVGNQVRKGTLTRIASSQALKVVKSASPALGFEYTDRVQEFLDFYTSPQQRKGVEIMLGLSDTYLNTFSQQLDELGMPADLKYLPMALSSLNTRTVSDWGATGLWLIMFTNGKLFNLQVDSYVDERRDPVKSTRAALQYLQDLHKIYLDWELAIAAYTSSPSSVNKAIRKAGGSKKYTDIYPYLPVETRDYLPAFTACFILMNQLDKTGLKPYDIDVPNYELREPVAKRLHLGQVSELIDIPLALLQDMNPEYKSSIIPAGTRTYEIKLPVDKIPVFRSLADSMYQFKDSVYFPVRRNVVVSDIVAATPENGTKSNGTAQVEQNTTRNTQNRTKLTYTVKDGDNLGYISSWYNVGVSDIRGWNSLSGDVIRVGQTLDIWVPESKASQYKGIDEMTFSQKQATGSSTTTTAQAKTNAKPATSNQSRTTSSGSYSWYTVKKGDNPSTIAAKYPGVSANDIMTLNKISDPRTLKEGQKLKIPRK